jgi:hypothetical protein
MKLTVKLTTFLIFAFFQAAYAEKLDLATHNSLIEKIESATKLGSKDAMVMHANLAHRLADLYAERARLLSMDQEGHGEQIHARQIESDRRKSIATLSQIVNVLDKNQKGPALLQMAHLHDLLNEPQESVKICQQIVKNPAGFDGKTKALAEIQLGDVAFVKGTLPEAQTHFEKALKFEDNPRRGYTYFRLAWIHFDRGQSELSEKEMITLLQTPDLFKTASGAIDASFKEEASHDLATFMARNDISADSTRILSSLSPDNTRKKNLIYLATELDRTSKKKSALIVWSAIGGQEISFEDQLDRQIQVTRIEYDLGHRDSLVKEIDNSIALLKNPACKNNSECTVATQNLRRVITDWAKAEERSPSAALIAGFQKFSQNFDDAEMSYWAAQSATQRKQYRDAFKFYIQAATTLHAISEKTPVQQKMFEGALLGSLAVAELSKDADLRLPAYQKYLEFNANGAKRDEVRYQIAHWYYEKNDYAKASNEFRILALDPKMNLALREKSGDLCLDSDVLLKDEALIEAHSLELSQGVPSKKAEYQAIWRKSILNQTAKVINNSDSKATAVFEKQLQKIQSVSLVGFPADQRKTLIKHKIELAYRLKNLESLTQSSRELLSTSGLSHEDQAMALHHLAWVAEITMNFKMALNYMAQIHPSHQGRADYFLKLAMLKELSSENPSAEYKEFLAASHDSQKRQYAAHQIVLNSKHPQQDFRKYESLLAANSELYGSAGVFVFEKTGDDKFAKHLMAKSSFRNSAKGQLMAHHFAFQDYQALKSKMAHMKLKPQSDRGLKKALAERTALLKKVESLANQAIQQKDTTKELIYLPLAAHENSRLADEIMALPAPRGMKPKQKADYQLQVQALVQPYMVQSKAIQAKTTELWKQAINNNAYQALTDWSLQKNKPGCQLAADELSVLRGSARQAGLAADPFEKLTEQRQKVTVEAQSLHQQIAKDPFNSNDLEKMKTLELSLGSGPMVAYLDNRLNELKAHGGRN